MKIPCHVIEDLLPLYHDEVCSQESCTLIQEHLKDCESCKRLLSKIEEETVPMVSNIDDAAPIKSISAKWKKSKHAAFFKGTIITIVMCACLFGVNYGLTKWKCIPVSPDLLEVTDISRLDDGRIIYHLNVKDNKELSFIKFTTNTDGSYYITPMRSIIESKRTMENGLFKDYFMVDIEENNAYQQAYGDGIIITSCYLGPQDNGILLWKDGMELPKASKDLEAMVK